MADQISDMPWAALSVRTRTTLPMDDKGLLLELFSTVVAFDIWSFKVAAACRSQLGSRMYNISITVLAQIWGAAGEEQKVD